MLRFGTTGQVAGAATYDGGLVVHRHTGLPQSWCPDKSPCPGLRRLRRVVASCLAFHSRYDVWGDLLTSQPAGPDSATLRPTTYVVDAAGHMLTIDDGTPAQRVSFVLDALGRHSSQSVGTGGGSVTTVTDRANPASRDQVKPGQPSGLISLWRR